MNAQVLSSSKQEINLSVKESDIATLYIIQHELLKDSNVDFAGVIVKHPLTNECWVRINSKSNPIQDLKKATDSAIKIADDVKKLFNSTIKE
ncbi:MAG: RpoL/Rpb11 RNA polymerase subunit family protein [Nitrosopumilaceae archaeon]|nr:RpoL/Rpb11 RNA polymerase subunit family protein [Nitrosopumilaceae archaeon]